MRLDVFLAVQMPEFSRSWLQKLIEKGNIKVGTRKRPASYKIKQDENIFVSLELPPEISLAPEDNIGQDIKVVYENSNFIILEKPAGVVVHPSSATPKRTLVNWLLSRWPEIKNVGDPLTESGQGNLSTGCSGRALFIVWIKTPLA